MLGNVLLGNCGDADAVKGSSINGMFFGHYQIVD